MKKCLIILFISMIFLIPIFLALEPEENYSPPSPGELYQAKLANTLFFGFIAAAILAILIVYFLTRKKNKHNHIKSKIKMISRKR